MNAVVYRGARTHKIEIRVAEALCADPPRERAIPGRIPAGRRSRADDVLAGPAVPLVSPASDRVNGIVPPVDGGWPGR
ncbi:hypothetical protein ACIQVC_36055 [Streptomyces sp. NPDC101112]|jgi:NAD(P)-dependent dehydrogenase (short-subunit alcohol dehydrogenase family)|uniref:hypothetical protein n=1 Tax=Streptomyces sp. NPDC101112 TaxID=3366105 RepID=UPI0038204A0C